MRTRESLRPVRADGARRLFFALWPGDGVRAALAGAAGALRSAHPTRGRWLDPRHYHLTLRFLGDCDAAQEAAALAAGDAVHAARFDLTFDRAGSFGNRSIPWWLGCAQAPAELQRLWEALDAALRNAGAWTERDHPPVAHVTVLRDAQVRLPGVPISPVSWPVREFVLVHSVPGSQPAYHPLARWPLSAPA